jgi:DNA-binding transcriptional LysR family regulator
MTPHIDDLRLFFEVAKAGNITAAARRLELPKSTVSRRLIQFEESLGIRLLHKTTRKITMPTDVGIHWFADFLAGFAHRHPDVKLSLDFTGRRLDLIGERFDVALRAGALTGSEAVARKLFSWTWQLYASPAYLRENGTPKSPADLADHRFVVLEAYSRPAPEIDLVSGQKVERITMPGVVVSNSLGVLRAMLIAGGGIGLVPARMAEEPLRKRQLVRVLPAWASRPLDIFYVIPSRRLLPAKTRLFVEELVEHVRAQERTARLKARQVNAARIR